MKKLVRVHQLPGSVDAAILLTRVVIAGLMLTHGLPKLAQLFSGEPVQFPPVLGLTSELALSLTVFAEVFCSILILVGYGTRLAVLPLIVTMLVAVLFIHADDPFSAKEPALHYLLVYLLLLFTGSGKYSLDYILQNRQVAVAY